MAGIMFRNGFVYGVLWQVPKVSLMWVLYIMGPLLISPRPCPYLPKYLGR